MSKCYFKIEQAIFGFPYSFIVLRLPRYISAYAYISSTTIKKLAKALLTITIMTGFALLNRKFVLRSKRPHFAKQKRQTLPVTVHRTAPVCYTRTLLKLIKEERKEADTQSVSASFLAPPVGLEPTTP